MLLQPHPPGFSDHKFTFSIKLKASETTIWSWLNKTETFTENQLWPYKVEFYSPDQRKIPEGFNEGILTNHIGPFINFPGRITSIQNDYRDLQYYYGAYAISHRLIRPYRLEFSTREQEAGTTLLYCALKSYVKPGWVKIWGFGCQLFWASFKKWSKRSIEKLELTKSKAWSDKAS
ncbi:MAG: hypothetical protein ACO2ZZ_07710 [Cyclobacteriaceae bacterium]